MLIVKCADVLACKVLLLLSSFEFVLFVTEWCTHWSFGCGQEFCCSQLQCLWYWGKIISVCKVSGLEARPFDVESSTFIISLHTSVCSYYWYINFPSLFIPSCFSFGRERLLIILYLSEWEFSFGNLQMPGKHNKTGIKGWGVYMFVNIIVV